LFKAEFAVENHDKPMGELLKETQQGLVGEYATNFMRYFKVLDLGEEARVRHFVRGLKFGIKETVMASGSASFLQAVENWRRKSSRRMSWGIIALPWKV
jgi:hypothetical protein